MGPGDVEVVVDDRQGADEIVEEGSAGLAPLSGGDLDADAEFGDRDRCDCGLVVVGDQRVEIDADPFSVDEGARVEQEQRQNRSSVTRRRRRSAISVAHERSMRWRRSRLLISAPDAMLTGSSCATTCPRRTIRYRSPRCSTPSRMSAKFLDAPLTAAITRAASVVLPSADLAVVPLGPSTLVRFVPAPYLRIMMRKFASLGVVIIVVAAGCGSTARRTEPITTTSTTSALPTTVAASTTTTAPTTTVAPTTALLGCREVGPVGAPPPPPYGEAAIDSFGPLEPAPSLTINVGSGERTGELVASARRIEGGLLVTAAPSPYAPDVPAGRLRVAAIDHDGTVRWSRCLDGDREIEAVVASPEQRPANALVMLPVPVDQEWRYRWVQLSLTTGVEQSTFAAALHSVGGDADGMARLAVADATDRYALLVDVVPRLGSASTYQRIVRFDLVADVAVDIAVPTELRNPTPGPCGRQPQLSLSDSGDVIVTNQAVLARWHDGTWSRDPATLATVVGVRPSFACTEGAAAAVLRGVDALGAVRWTDPDLTDPRAEGTGFYLNGAVAVGQVCFHRTGDGCDGFQLVGLDPTTGEVRWSQPGLRLLAGDPADGYVLTQAGDASGGSQPGWVLLDDRTGRSVPGQSWDDPTAFSHPCCGESELESTVRAGGLVLVGEGEQVRAWYPKGAGGEPRTALLP